MSTISIASNASSGLSSGSSSSDGPASSQESVPASSFLPPSLPHCSLHADITGLTLVLLSDRRASILSRPEDDKRLGWRNRKEWSVSKSQVLLERQDADEVRPNRRRGFGVGVWPEALRPDVCVCVCVSISDASGEAAATQEPPAGRPPPHPVPLPGGVVPAQPVQPSQPAARLPSHAAHATQLQYVCQTRPSDRHSAPHRLKKNLPLTHHFWFM